MIVPLLFALCLLPALAAASSPSYLEDLNFHKVILNDTQIDVNWVITNPDFPIFTYTLIANLQGDNPGDEGYWVDTDFCGGNCSSMFAWYAGDYNLADRNIYHYQDNPGFYFMYISLQPNSVLELDFHFSKLVDNTTGLRVNSTVSITVISNGVVTPVIDPLFNVSAVDMMNVFARPQTNITSNSQVENSLHINGAASNSFGAGLVIAMLAVLGVLAC